MQSRILRREWVTRRIGNPIVFDHRKWRQSVPVRFGPRQNMPDGPSADSKSISNQ
jgi:hypothetical protein